MQVSRDGAGAWRTNWGGGALFTDWQRGKLCARAPNIWMWQPHYRQQACVIESLMCGTAQPRVVFGGASIFNSRSIGSRMERLHIAAMLRALYDATERETAERPDVALRADYDYTSRPPERRPEAGFSVWIPPLGDGAYAGVHIMPAENGVTTHGEYGFRWSGGHRHTFSWPSVEVSDSDFVINSQRFGSAERAAQRLISILREHLITARSV